MARKTKKGKKKTKKMNPEEEKEAMLSAMMIKFGMSREDIEAAYQLFNDENPEGVISKEKYISSIKVISQNLLSFVYLQFDFAKKCTSILPIFNLRIQ